jgi:hypothetical protein
MGEAEDSIRTVGQDVSAPAKSDSDPEKGSVTDGDAIVRRDRALIVDWEGPDDPQNPHNWTKSQKAACITIVSVITFITSVRSILKWDQD